MNIKEIRLKTGLSQSQFAKKYHIPVGTLQHWEQGVRKPPEYVVYMLNLLLNQKEI
ncbi:MAG: helix-turn-helix domain-containing protein [Lachnospiraceae bacterium]|nr:helix-turn-helix domain-containing protein [Lachnospiraceae bacterium]